MQLLWLRWKRIRQEADKDNTTYSRAYATMSRTHDVCASSVCLSSVTRYAVCFVLSKFKTATAYLETEA